MATFAESKSAVAYDKNNASGALVTGMGYDPDTPATTTTPIQYMGGVSGSIGYHNGSASVSEQVDEGN